MISGAGVVALSSMGGLGQNSSLDLLEKACALSGPTYTIQQVGNTVTATPATYSGLKPISGSDAATVIMQACIPNSSVLIKAGTYVISSEYGVNIRNGSNVELYGDSSMSTILKLANSMNHNVFNIQYGSNINIHDLQIDGKRMNQSQAPGNPAINAYGITEWLVTNLTIANCYIHDCRDFGINLDSCSNAKILNNHVQNCDANGITVGNKGSSGAFAGSNTYVGGNVVDGASDVGITSWYGNGVLAENNTVRNITMNTSPWGNQSHVGMMIEHTSNNITYRNNTIENCGDGLSASGGTQVTLDSNAVSNCLRGFYAGAGNLTLKNCTFDQIANSPQSKLMFGVLRLDPNTPPTTITGCKFTNIGQYVLGGAVIQLLSPTGTLSNNEVHTDNGKYKTISAPKGWVLTNNTILP
jgi:hypothetical protein